MNNRTLDTVLSVFKTYDILLLPTIGYVSTKNGLKPGFAGIYDKQLYIDTFSNNEVVTGLFINLKMKLPLVERKEKITKI